MGQSQSTELQVFAGGLNIRPAPQLIQPHESRTLANVNVRALNLRPYRTPEFLEYAPEPFAYFFNNQSNYYPIWRSNAEWNGAWYWSDGLNTGKVMADGSERPIGIAPPTERPSVEEAQPDDGGDGISGNINYVYTYYEPDTGAESPPSPPSVTLDIEKAAVIITDFQTSADYQIRIYRIGGIISAYTAVETLPGATTTYFDQKKFSETQGMILDTMRAYPPPTNLHLLTEHQGRFFGAVYSKLYFTAAGKPDSWYALDFISFDHTITMIASVSNGLLIATDRETWLITGLSPINFAKHLISQSEGCIKPNSVQVIDGSAVWMSQTGFMMSNGAGVQSLSVHKLGLIRGIDPRGSAIFNRAYFMSFGGSLVPSNGLVPGPLGGDDDDEDVGDLVPGATSGDSNLPEGAIVIDFSLGEPVFSTIEEQGLGDLGTFLGYLHAISMPEFELNYLATEDLDAQFITEGGIFNFVAEVNTGQSLFRMFEGLDLTRIRYRSPLLTDGSIGVQKQYEKVRVTFIGVMTITILNDDGEQLQKSTLIATKRDSQWVGIPVAFNRAYGIQFIIEGLCEVDSLLYTWTPRESQ